MKIGNINLFRINFFSAFILTFAFPNIYFREVLISKVIFLFLNLLILLLFFIENKKFNVSILQNFITIIIIFLFTTNLNSIFMIIIINLLFLIQNVDFSLLRKSLIDDLLLVLILFFVSLIFYTFYYSEKSGVINIYISILDPNETSLLLMILGFYSIKRFKFVGFLVFIIGTLTFSRNYLLALLVYIFIMFVYNLLPKIVKKAIINFSFMIFLSSSVLFIIGYVFVFLAQKGYLFKPSFNFQKFFNLIDLSNYLRFSTNYLLIKSMLVNPSNFILGFKGYSSYRDSITKVSNLIGVYYTGNTPHNYFFSQLRILGVSVFYQIYLLNELFKKILDSRNIAVFMSILTYAIFLGSSFSGSWLVLATGLLIIYGDKK